MAALQYREDMDEARERLTCWWQGGDIGRPLMLLTAPRAEPAEHVAVMPEPEGWVCRYSTSNFEYRVNEGLRRCVNTWYLGEAVPTVSPDLAPNCLALYLGCKGIEMPDTVWCEPLPEDPDPARLALDPGNFYWRFTLRLTRELRRLCNGKFLVEFPDLIEGLDTLAAMRGTQPMLLDLVARPDWVRACLRRITDLYFHCYDVLYDMMRDEAGGSGFWIWAPGRMVKLQCDISAALGPAMFGEFMGPVLREMTERTAHSMYHWDGVEALVHEEQLLAIPDLDMLQWTPGYGHEPPPHKRWWPLLHRIVEAGKKVYLSHEVLAGDIAPLKREFGPKLKQFAIEMPVESVKQAEELVRLVSD